MIVTLENTTTSEIDKKLHRLRDEGGVVTLGRVLTLVIMAEAGRSERALDAAILASHEHPCRIIMHVSHSASEATRLDAQLRIGGDAGASEVVVLHGYGELAEPTEMLMSALLLPDAPIVAWWPHRVPDQPSDSSIGQIAHRRIMDSSNAHNVREALSHLAQQYTPGDTDISWTRLTHWRVQLAAAMDQAEPAPVTEVVVTGAADSSRVHLLGAWLGNRLEAPVRFAHVEKSQHGLEGVRLVRPTGDIVLERPGQSAGTLKQPGQPDQRVAIPHRELSACLAEELRQLDPDEVYGEVLTFAGGAYAQDDGAPLQVETEHSKEVLAERVAGEINKVLVEAQQQRGRAGIALTGGSMGIATIRALAASTRTAEHVPDWSHVDLWWSDERFLPDGDVERNVQQAAEVSQDFALLNNIPPENIHPMGSSDHFDSAVDAAADYMAELKAAAQAEGREADFPTIDIAVLGMGPDGHVASVFPDHPETRIKEPSVVAVEDSPKPPPVRVSMTLPLISTADHVWYVVSGEDKAEAVGRLLHGGSVAQTPACGVQGRVSTILFATPDALEQT